MAKTIQLLRSSAVYASLELAKTGIQNATGRRQDGELLLGRYWSGTGANAVIKSVIGIYHKSPDLEAQQGETINAGWTFIQDITSSSEGLQELQNELDATQTGAGLSTTGGYIVKDGDAIIGQSTSLADAINDIADYIQDTVEKQKVTNSDHSITVTEPTGNATTTDIAVNIKTGENVIKLGNDGIYTNLNVVKVITSGTAGTGEELDATLGTNVKEGYRLKDSDGNTIGQTIKIYKDSALHTVYLGHTDDTVNTADGTHTSGTGDTALCFVYQQADGTYALVAVNVESFLQEGEFKDGLSVNSSTHEVSVNIGNGLEFTGSGSNRPIAVKVDSTSESFLTVGANGVKLSGVQNAIDTAKSTIDDYEVNGKKISTSPTLDGSDINVDETAGTKETVKAAIERLGTASTAAKTAVAEGTDAGNNMSIAKTTDANGADTYTISLSGIAQDSEVVKSVNGVSPVSGAVTIDGADITLDGYTKGTAPANLDVASTDTVNAAIAKLEHQVDAAEAAAAAGATVVAEGTDAGNNMSISESTDANDGHKTYTINLTDVASAQALSDEVTRAQTAEAAIDTAVGLTKAANAETRSITPTTNYGSGSTTVMDNMQALDTALKNANDNALTGVAAGNGINVSTKASNSQTITAVAVSNDPVIEVTANGIGTKADANWDCGTF